MDLHLKDKACLQLFTYFFVSVPTYIRIITNKRSSDIISLIHIDYHNTFDFYVLLFKIKSMRSQQITLQQVNYPTNIPAGTIYILAISKDHKDFKKYHGNYVFHTLIQGSQSKRFSTHSIFSRNNYFPCQTFIFNKLSFIERLWGYEVHKLVHHRSNIAK